MNKKIPLLALGMLTIGVIGSIAFQAFAQTPPIQIPAQSVTSVTTNNNQEDQSIDQKDSNGKDLETADDSKITSISTEKDTDSDSLNEQNDQDSDQTEQSE